MPPNYFTRLRNTSQNGIQDAIEILIWQKKFRFDNYRLFHSAVISAVSDTKLLLGPRTVCAANSDFNQRRNVSVVGALYRTFSVPSVSGPTFQACRYQVDRVISEPSQISVSCNFLSKPMAVSGFRAVMSECISDTLSSKPEQISLFKNKAEIVYRNRNVVNCGKANMCLSSPEQPSNTSPIYGYFIYKIAKGWTNLSLNSSSGIRALHSSASALFPSETANDVSFDNSSCEEQLSNPAEGTNGKISTTKTLKLVSGSCYIPHPDKEETGGEDAHFICSEEQAIGVADGVGGWAELGVDSGLYSRELMSNSVSAIHEEPKGSVDPARVLEKAHSSTKAKGSSTACIIALTDQGLHAVNLGDSGFMVVRDGCTVFRSPVQQHDFNFTYQLESGHNGDLPSSGQVFNVPVASGDVVISGTDGLFDNLYNNEITAVVVHAMRAGLGPQVTAQKIAALARQRAQDKDRQTPFSTAAQDAGFRYYGGKLDDITVVVSYITGSDEEKKESS